MITRTRIAAVGLLCALVAAPGLGLESVGPGPAPLAADRLSPIGSLRPLPPAEVGFASTPAVSGLAGAAPSLDADQGWEGVYDQESYLAPPDPTGAIGPNVYVQLVNDWVGIFQRSGTLVATGPITQLAGASDVTDPQVIWDPHTQRFYYLALNRDNNSLAWGFSKDASPSSLKDSFCRYGANFGYGSRIPDFPKLGQTTSHLLAGVNVFGSSFEGSDLLWFSKPQGIAPITSCPPLPTFRTGRVAGLRDADGQLIFTPVPVVQTDPSETGWIVSSMGPSALAGGSRLTLFRVGVAPDGAATVEPTGTSVAVPAFEQPIPAI